MPKGDDVDWFKQMLRATFPYIVLCITFILGMLAIILWASSEETSAVTDPPPLLTRAHSHNDYLRKRPLMEALDLGFCSVEADIHLVNGALLVAHDLNRTQPDRTLEALYLKPLWARFEKQGSVHTTPAPFTLLIDIKSAGKATFLALQAALQPFAPMLTQFSDSSTTPGAVTIVISGNRAIDTILTTKPRLTGVDGRLSDLDGNYTAHDMPLISDNWRNHFTWRGKGDFPEAEREKLRVIVHKAHEKGMRVRFWAIPQRPVVWKTLYQAEVDLLNADFLSRLRDAILEAQHDA